MNYTNMYQALRKILDKDEQIDYAMSGETAAHIEMWSALYKDKAPWLDSNTQSAGIAAAVAGEIARLTVLEVKSEVSGSAKASYIDKIYQRVIENLRIQVEYADAKGSLIFKPYVTANGISIQYIQADNFFPLEFDTETITKCAFLDQFRRDNEIYSRIEIHTLKDGLLNIRNRAFVSRTEGLIGTEIPVNSVPKWSELVQEITFSGTEKLPFGYFRVPLGNNQDSGSPLGTSTFSRAVKHIREADKRYSQINWEYESKASKQRSYSFVQSCQTALQHALEDLVDAIAFWCDIYQLCPSGTYQTSFDWDDSIVTDVESERQSDRLDVSMGAMPLWEYRMKWYGETEEQAKAAVQKPEETVIE